MREQLIQYLNLLFAGTQNCEDIKLEILQNTLDRYDDLISQGKTPEAAYRLAISGIGDINEILGRTPSSPAPQSIHTATKPEAAPQDTTLKMILRAVAIGLYILCPVPLFVLSEIGMPTLGLCGTIGLVAVATVLIILGQKKQSKHTPEDESSEQETLSPREELRKSVNSTIWAVGLALYFLLSFTTGAWFITWIIFPLIGCVQGLVRACMDLKEANHHEN